MTAPFNLYTPQYQVGIDPNSSAFQNFSSYKPSSLNYLAQSGARSLANPTYPSSASIYRGQSTQKTSPNEQFLGSPGRTNPFDQRSNRNSDFLGPPSHGIMKNNSSILRNIPQDQSRLFTPNFAPKNSSYLKMSPDPHSINQDYLGNSVRFLYQGGAEQPGIRESRVDPNAGYNAQMGYNLPSSSGAIADLRNHGLRSSYNFRDSSVEDSSDESDDGGMSMKSMLPMIMMMEMNRKKRQEEAERELYTELNNQNQMLFMMQNQLTMSNKNTGKSKKERQELEARIEELDSRIRGNWPEKKRNAGFYADSKFKSTEVAQNPFLQKQLLANQEMLMKMLQTQGLPRKHIKDMMDRLFHLNGAFSTANPDEEDKKARAKKKKKQAMEQAMLKEKEEEDRRKKEQEAREFQEKLREQEKDEEKRKEEEKKQAEVALKEKVKRYIRKLKGYVWQLCSYNMFKKTLLKQIQAKKEEEMAGQSDILAQLVILGRKQIGDLVKKPVEALAKDSKLNVNFVTAPEKIKPYNAKPPSKSGADEKAKQAAEKCKAILTALIDGTKEETFDPELIKLIAKVSMNRHFLLQNFHFDQEIDRMNFSIYGTLKEMSIRKVKMIAVCLLIFQILLPMILKKPWEFCEGVSGSLPDCVRLSFRVISSVIYWLFYDWIKNNVPIMKNNQIHLSVDLKVKGRGTRYRLDDNVPAIPYKPKTGEEQPILDDVFDKKDDLNSLFGDNKEALNMLKGISEGWVDKIGTLVENAQNELENEERRSLKEVKNQQKNEVEKVLNEKNMGDLLKT